jgi:molybdenum cofactor biosynthesis enzyme
VPEGVQPVPVQTPELAQLADDKVKGRIEISNDEQRRRKCIARALTARRHATLRRRRHGNHHVIRGDDMSTAPRARSISSVLSAKTCRCMPICPVLNEQGEKLSKRNEQGCD